MSEPTMVDVTPAGRRVLIVSQRRVQRLFGYSINYELEDVIQGVESADRLDIQSTGRDTAWVRLSQRFNGVLRQYTGGRFRVGGPLPGAAAGIVRQDYDLAIVVGNNVFDARLLTLLRGLRERVERVVYYVSEIWPLDVGSRAFRQMPFQLIDHIFVVSGAMVAPIAQASGVPTTELALAVDTLRFRPTRTWEERQYDVCWFGRRMQQNHEDIQRLVRESGWRYYYDPDTVTTTLFDDYLEHRKRFAALIGDSRFTLCHYARANQPEINQGLRVIGARSFEGAAAGCVLLGAPPTVRQFDELFDWEDALIPIGLDEPRVDRILAELAVDSERMKAISRRNVAGMMRGNDWAHRWASMLDVLKQPRGEGLQRRLALLEREAAAFDPAARSASRAADSSPT
jgi:hypothetical protein